jgi:hypothetical protein
MIRMINLCLLFLLASVWVLAGVYVIVATFSP